MQVSFTCQRDDFVQYEGAKLHYGNLSIGDELFFYASPLLFERGIRAQKIKMGEHLGVPIFFIHSNNPELPFDPFAASFFLLSRYEEYLPHQKDEHGRFPAEESVAYKHHFLHLPVVDIWIDMLREVLLKHYPNTPIVRRQYKFVPTYDIDIAYAYRNKGLLRNLGGYLQSLRHGRIDTMRYRTRVLFGFDPDPYDTYDFQMALQQKYGFRPSYFFLVGDYAMYDKNISIEKLTYQNLIRYLADFYDAGIHPSYESNKSDKILRREIADLAQIIRRDIKKSRQHYLKLSIPQTYQQLIALDIEKDYSMGYSSQLGFRAGTSSSFDFYDLSLETPTYLRIMPFAVMDVTLHDYLKLSPELAVQKVGQLIAVTKKVNGLFCTIWHNHTLSDAGDWQGWRQVYADIVDLAMNK